MTDGQTWVVEIANDNALDTDRQKTLTLVHSMAIYVKNFWTRWPIFKKCIVRQRCLVVQV